MQCIYIWHDNFFPYVHQRVRSKEMSVYMEQV